MLRGGGGLATLGGEGRGVGGEGGRGEGGGVVGEGVAGYQHRGGQSKYVSYQHLITIFLKFFLSVHISSLV